MKKYKLLMELRFGIEGEMPDGIAEDQFKESLRQRLEAEYAMKLMQVLIFNGKNPDMVQLSLRVEQ